MVDGEVLGQSGTMLAAHSTAQDYGELAWRWKDGEEALQTLRDENAATRAWMRKNEADRDAEARKEV